MACTVKVSGAWPPLHRWPLALIHRLHVTWIIHRGLVSYSLIKNAANFRAVLLHKSRVKLNGLKISVPVAFSSFILKNVSQHFLKCRYICLYYSYNCLDLISYATKHVYFTILNIFIFCALQLCAERRGKDAGILFKHWKLVPFPTHTGPLLHALLLLRGHDVWKTCCHHYPHHQCHHHPHHLKLESKRWIFSQHITDVSLRYVVLLRLSIKNHLKLPEDMFFTPSQQPIEYTSHL